MTSNFLGLGLASTLLFMGVPTVCAQNTAPDARLAVRPSDMATGTENPVRGVYPLDADSDVLVSVPSQCEGTKRCPLFVFLPGAGYGGKDVTEWLRPAADKYGMILLAPSQKMAYSPPLLDEALKQVLQTFAIDSEKIAIVGRCKSGTMGLYYGMGNLDVFRRAAAISPTTTAFGKPRFDIDTAHHAYKATEFLLDAGFPESALNFLLAREARGAGHRVKLSVGFRGHEHQVENYDFLGHWLQESWAIPDPTARPAGVVADPLPLLTPDLLARMSAFWNAFLQQPDSIRTVARRAHLREVVMLVGGDQVSVWMTDMPALAAKYPAVASALNSAGLTAEQHEAYRIALLSARVAQSLIMSKAGIIEASPVLKENLAFLDAHPDELKALEDTGMWKTP